jgi:thymidylate synthase
MNNIDKQYQDLLQTILDYGVEKKDRTGTGTKSIFGYTIRHNMKHGFPLLTTKKMAWKTMVTELLWFLRGDTNIKYLVDNNCHIWDGDCFSNYLKNRDRFSNKDNIKEDVVLNGINGSSNRAYTKEEFINKIKTDDEFAKKWGELGPVYGKQWRSWGDSIIDDLDEAYNREVEYDTQNGKIPTGSSMRKFVIDEIKKYKPNIDQIANLINELKTNPDSRRLMVSAWNVGELNQMVLPPCHYGFQVYTRELSEQERMDLYNKSNWNKDIFPSDVSGWNRLLDSYNIPTRAISLMYNCRSQDVPLGTPFNISSYALLLMMIAKQVNMVPDQLIGNLGDCHIYLNQIDGVKEQLTREPYPLPTVKILNAQVDDIAHYEISDFELIDYQYHPTIKMPLSN